MVTYFLSDIKEDSSGAFNFKPSQWAVVPSRPSRSNGKAASRNTSFFRPSTELSRRASLLTDYQVLMSAKPSEAFPSFPSRIEEERSRAEEPSLPAMPVMPSIPSVVEEASAENGSRHGGGSRHGVGSRRSSAQRNETFNFIRASLMSTRVADAPVAPEEEDTFTPKPLPGPTSPTASRALASSRAGRIVLGNTIPSTPSEEHGTPQPMGASRPLDLERGRSEVEEVATGAIG